VPWGGTHQGCPAAPFIPVKKLLFCYSDHDLSPKSWGEAALAGCYVNHAPCACRKPSSGWYGNPSQSIQRCWVGDSLFGESTVVAVEMETVVPKGMRGWERPMQSYIYLENFVL